MRLGEAAAVSDILSTRPALVVIATGSVPVSRPAPQSKGSISEVGPYDDGQPEGHVLIRDEMGGLAALLTAERFSLSSERVSLVTSMLHPGEGDGLTTVYPLIRDCAARGIKITDRAKVKMIEGRTVHLDGVFGEAREPIERVDRIVSLLDMKAEDNLVQPLRAGGLNVNVIGDARLPRSVAEAVSDAARHCVPAKEHGAKIRNF